MRLYRDSRIGEKFWKNRNGRRPQTPTSFNKILEMSNIDQRAMTPSRHTAAITGIHR
jgi:hypothetical protein